MKRDEKILELISTEREKTESLSKGSTDIHLIESILDRAIKKLELFLTLPILLQDDGESLGLLVKENEFDKFKGLMSVHDITRTGVIKEQESEDDLIFYTYNDSNLEVLFNNYNANPDKEATEEDREFYSLLNKLYCKSKVARVCEQLREDLSPSGKSILQVMEQMKETMVKVMKESSQEEKMKEKELSDMVQYNDWAKDELAVLSRKFALTMNKQAQKMGEKCKEAGQIQERTDAVLNHSKEMADFLGRTAENKMIWERKKSEYVQDNLGTEAKKFETEFETIFNQNIVKEKNLRVKRYKTEAQLITILKKYDVDIKERDRAYRDLLAIFNEEQRQLNEIKEQFETQAVDYHALMDEKEEYERTIWEEKLYAIQKVMAARRIQRYYRMYVGLCQATGFVRFKKKGKGKKKK